MRSVKVTPTFQTLKNIAAALDTHPALLVADKKSEHAWTWTRHEFEQWKRGLRWKPGADPLPVHLKDAKSLTSQ